MTRSFTTTAILLKRIDFGDYDLIITFLTLTKGKISVIAKYAKKSTKRFAGILEPFSVLQMVCSPGKNKRLHILQEATLKEPFAKIRTDIYKTAYASYWVELIDKWVEKGEKEIELFHLLWHVLEKLDTGEIPQETLSILFQIRFMVIAGMCPNLSYCAVCKTETDNIVQTRIHFDLDRGGLICGKCLSYAQKKIPLSKGTVKQLLWLENKKIQVAEKIKLSAHAIKEGLFFMETFVPYHIKKTPKSLNFLKQLRKSI